MTVSTLPGPQPGFSLYGTTQVSVRYSGARSRFCGCNQSFPSFSPPFYLHLFTLTLMGTIPRTGPRYTYTLCVFPVIWKSHGVPCRSLVRVSSCIICSFINPSFIYLLKLRVRANCNPSHTNCSQPSLACAMLRLTPS